MVDGAYYRRQAMTCRAVASRFRRPQRLLELADHFEQRALALEAELARGEVGLRQGNLIHGKGETPLRRPPPSPA